MAQSTSVRRSDSDRRAASAAHYASFVARALEERQTALGAALADLGARSEELGAVATALIQTLRDGNTILVAGNGGSAAQAHHFAAELVGRFLRERNALPAVALCSDGAVLTALANDFGYSQIFARQVRALGRRGDLLLVFSTSGESDNLVHAAEAARSRGLTVVAMTGAKSSRLECLADLPLRVAATDTPVIQEMHSVISHILCEILESEHEITNV